MEHRIDAILSPRTPFDCAVEDNATKDDTIGVNSRNDEGDKRWKASKLDPPKDDCCPICFGEFSIPCRANCHHWFCASCILEYWNYSSASKPCKCPMCFVAITKLSPHEPSQFREEEDRKALKNIQRYNRLYAGGIHGFFQKFLESPLLIKRLIFRMMDADRPDAYYTEMRVIALVLTFVYKLTSSTFLPTGGLLDAFELFQLMGIGLLVIMRLIGMYIKWRLKRRMLHLAAAQPRLMLQD